MVNAFHTDSGLVSTALRPIRKKFAKPPVKRDETGEPSIAGYYWPKAFTADDDSSNCSPLKCN
ncbi:hypothetical protein N7494_005116 [Penicillium frequentans]|uniref:Uncharacterized protein n=1 Tax=Penicillium frequentans TaxID=3151616 RepID=A0AAD6CYS9_9EURO|nr:hypothetical protein N7494_005116 [Penicillium glabrum]